MRVVTGILTLVIVLTVPSCGSDEPSPTSQEQAASTNSSSATPTPPRPQVSDKTTCDLIFDSEAKTTEFDVVLDFINRGDNSSAQGERTQEAIDELREIGMSASPNLGAQLAAFADAAQGVLDEAYDGGGGTLDTTALRAAGLEVTNVCEGLY